MNDLIRKHRDDIWRSATGEPVEAAFPADLMRIEQALKKFAYDLEVKYIAERLKAKVADTIERRKRQNKFTPPRYDEVFFEGAAHLAAVARGEIDG